MKHPLHRSIAATLLVGLAASSTLMIAPVANSAEIVVAQDTSSVVSVKTAIVRPLTAVPSAVGALNIQAAPNSKVTVKAKNTKPIVISTNKSGTAQVNKLTPGVAYTVTSGANRVTAIPETKVAPATSLRVVTTDIPGQLELRWQHQVSAAQGVVGFHVSAHPINDPTNALEVETTNTDLVLTDLDLDTRYEFTVTSHNSISQGTPTKAVMTKTLNEILGAARQSTSEKQPVAVAQPVASPPQPVTPSGPSTRTIYVCPEGFTETGGLCQKETPYTFSTLAYTFHNETRVEACSGPDCPGSVYRSYPVSDTAPHCPQGGTIHGSECAGWTDGSRTVTYQVKDAAPAGYTDNGSEWIMKDPIPAGYSDNGSAWVTFASKEARVVPA